MSVKIAEINDIPAALPIGEAEDEREKLIEQAASENQIAAENELLETEEDEEFENGDGIAKTFKKKTVFGVRRFCLLLYAALGTAQLVFRDRCFRRDKNSRRLTARQKRVRPLPMHQ